MSLPEFTAERSLYRVSEPYHVTTTAAGPSGGSGVVPQGCFRFGSEFICCDAYGNCWRPGFGPGGGPVLQ